MKKSFQNLLLMSLRCRLDAFCDKEEFKKRANFYEYFHVQLLTEPVDLNLIMFWNFIGIKLLNSIGYRPTSLIFLVLNFLILLLTFFIQYDEYEPDTCQYSYLNIILIFFNWVFMAVFFGGSSLLAQQKLIDYYSLLDPSKEEEKNSYNLINSSAENDYIIPEENIENEKDDLNMIDFDKIDNIDNINKIVIEKGQRDTKTKIQKQKDMLKEKNFKSLIVFGLANIAAYTGKYGIAIGFSYYKQKNMIIPNNETINNNTYEISKYVEFLISNSSDIPDVNNVNNTLANYELSQNIFIYINVIYIGCILISVILYSCFVYCFFQNIKKEKEKSECCSCSCNCCLWSAICEICGCIFYSERVLLDKGIQTPTCCRLCYENCCNFCNDAFCCGICNSCGNQQSCCDCCYFDENHFAKGKQCFCYCYQEKRFCLWIYYFFNNETQKEIIPCMIFCFISRLSTIGCQMKYEDILFTKDILKEMPAFLLSLAGFFFFFSVVLSWVNLFKFSFKLIESLDEDIQFEINQIDMCNYLKMTLFRFVKKYNINFIGIFLLLCLNILLGFNHSFGILYRGFVDYIFNIDEEFNERNILYVVILSNAYLIFLVNFYCLIIAKNRISFEFVFSQTILVTIYLTIINYIIYVLKILLQNQDNAILFQFIVTSILGFFIFFVFFRFIYFFFIAISDSCQYFEGNCLCQACCCNQKSSCYIKCCESKCTYCYCYYICCEPCFSRIYNLIFKE